MKLRNIFTMLAAALTLAFAGCEEPERFLDEVKVSKSYISLPKDGGKVEIDVDAAADWSIVAWDLETNKPVEIPEWFTVDPMSGSKGKSVVTFSAEASSETNEAVLHLNCGKATQILKVVQVAAKPEVELKTCAWINSNGEDGVTYRAKGFVTLVNDNYAKYGGFTINDGTADLVVYGSDGNTAYPDLTVGDEVVVEGPWATKYSNFGNGTLVLSVTKSLISVEKTFPAEPLPLEGGVMTVLLTVKGEGLTVEIPEDAKSWLTAGEPADLAGLTSVELTAAANAAGARNTTVTFKTTSGGVDYVATADVEQLGAIAEVSVADFLAAAEGTSLYKLTGVVKNIVMDKKDPTKPNAYGNFDLVDATGSVYVYGLTATPQASNDQSFISLGLKEGDIVTIIGTRASYKDTPQVGGPAYYVSHVTHTEATVAEFLAKKEGDAWYKLTGVVKNIVMDKKDPTKPNAYGNFDLVDETGSVYVYGLTATPQASNDQSFISLGLKEGDTVTIIGTRASYKDTPQVGGPAYYVSHEAAGEGGGDAPVDDVCTLSFDDKANRTVFNESQQVWVKNGVTVTNDKASSTNNIADYAKPVRFYKGSSVTVAMKGMKKIDFACNNASYAEALKNSITDSSVTVSVNEKVVTVTFAAAVDSFKVATLGAQVRMDSVTVYTK